MTKVESSSKSSESKSSLLKFLRALVPTTKPHKGRRARIRKREGEVTATPLLGLRITIMVEASEREKEALWRKAGKEARVPLAKWKQMNHAIWLTDWRWKVQWLS